jgi:hypothetical protein
MAKGYVRSMGGRLLNPGHHLYATGVAILGNWQVGKARTWQAWPLGSDQSDLNCQRTMCLYSYIFLIMAGQFFTYLERERETISLTSSILHSS